VVSQHVDVFIKTDGETDIADGCGFFEVPIVDCDLGGGSILEHTSVDLVQHVCV